MLSPLERFATLAVATVLIVGAWVAVAFASGLFIGLARIAYDWVV